MEKQHVIEDYLIDNVVDLKPLKEGEIGEKEGGIGEKEGEIGEKERERGRG